MNRHLKGLTEQSSLKCIGGALKHAQREGGRGGVTEREREMERRGEQLVNVADHLYISQGIQSLLSCCCASRLGFVKQFLILSYYWNRGAMLHAGFAGIKSILWIHLGT